MIIPDAASAKRKVQAAINAQIEASRTPKGGWTRDQLAAWGVPWPPPKGWRKALVDRAVLLSPTA